MSTQTFTTPGRPWLRPAAVAGAVLAAAGAVWCAVLVFSSGHAWYANLGLVLLTLVLVLATLLLALGAVGGNPAPVALTVHRRGLLVERGGRTYLSCAWADMGSVRVSRTGRPVLVLVPAGSWDAYLERNPDAARFTAIGRRRSLAIDLQPDWVGPLETALRRLGVAADAS